MTDYDPLKRLGLTEIMEDFGLAILPHLMAQGDPEAPRLWLIDPGDGNDLEYVQRAIGNLEATLNPEQRQQLTTIVAGLCAHMLDLAAPAVLEYEAREASKIRGKVRAMQDEAWLFATERWRSDPTIRTGQMVNYVRAHLEAQGYKPPGEKRVREWLWYKPTEATHGGRGKGKK